MKKSFVFILGLFFITSQFAFAEVAVTIYNNNRALVKDTRDITLKKGIQSIEFDEVAANIDPTSVLPKFLGDSSKIKILEQNFDYDLVDSYKLLSKYIGKDIEVERLGRDKRKNVKGQLLSVNNGIVIQTDEKIILNPLGEISLSEMPEGLRLKPTLTWLLNSEFEGANKIEVAYQTGGMGWNADYVLVTDDKDRFADITGWVTVNNHSGATYKEAKLKLIAGDVNMVQPEAPVAMGMMSEYDENSVRQDDKSFEEKSFFEYHIYQLQRKSTIKNNEIKQIEFTSALKIPINKVFKFVGSQNQKVTVNLEFKNSKDNNLGIPLPKGRIRVCKYDGDSMEFVGENYIDHTAKDAEISVYIGNAFDITGERIQTGYKSASKSSEEEYKITIKNSKDEEVEVNVVEPMYGWVNWAISENSIKYEKVDSNNIEFKVKVPADSEKILTYKVKYSWK